MRDADFAARSAALQKAMSAALLNHQINELEAQVHGLGVSDGNIAGRHQQQKQLQAAARLNPSARIWGDDDDDDVRHLPARASGADDFGVIGGGRKAAGTSPRPVVAQREVDGASNDRIHDDQPGQGGVCESATHLRHGGGPAGPQVRKMANIGRIDDTPQDSDSVDGGHNTRSESSDDEDEEDQWDSWKIVVLDVSALMWAPQSVRRLLARGWEAVLPLEAIRTLDILKKGSSPAAVAARAATRYVEHAMRQYSTLPTNSLALSSLPSSAIERGRGLRIQREDEVAEIKTLTDLPIPTGDIPRWAINVLECVAHVADVARTHARRTKGRDPNGPDDSVALQGIFVVANPPLRLEVDADTPSVPAGRQGKDGYIERGEGYLISQEAERFEVGLEVLRDEELDEMEYEQGGSNRRGRGKAGRGGTNGRGRGRGGADGGRGGRGGRPTKSRGGAPGRDTRAGERGVSEPEPEVKILLRRPNTTTDEEDSPRVTQTSLGESSPAMPGDKSLPASPRAPARKPTRRGSYEFVPLRKEDVEMAKQTKAKAEADRVTGSRRDEERGEGAVRESRGKGPRGRGGRSGGKGGGPRPPPSPSYNGENGRAGSHQREPGLVLLQRPTPPSPGSSRRDGRVMSQEPGTRPGYIARPPQAQQPVRPQILRRPDAPSATRDYGREMPRLGAGPPASGRPPTHALPSRPDLPLGGQAVQPPRNTGTSENAPPRGIVLLQRPKPG